MVCKDYKQNKCEWGNQCNDKHPENRKNSPQKGQCKQKARHKKKENEQNKCPTKVRLNMKKLVNAVKEGFKTQNEFLVHTIKGNSQTQQRQRNHLFTKKYQIEKRSQPEQTIH